MDLSTLCGLRRSGSAGLEPATMMPLQVPGTEDEGRTPTSARADKAVSASRQGQAIREDPADKTLTPTASSQIAPNNYSLLLQRGGAASSDPLSLTGRFWRAKCARCPGDWPKGAPSPLIGPEGGVTAVAADRPSNKESNMVLRGLCLLAVRRQPCSHPPD